MFKSFHLLAALAMCASVQASQTNCDSGVTILEENVVVTDIAFDLTDLTIHDEYSVLLDINYIPEQVIPFGFRSSVFMYVRKGFNNFNSGGNCGLEFYFDGWHSSYVYLDRDCLLETGDLTTYPQTYQAEVDYWYCLSEDGTCNDVDAAAVNFDATDYESLHPAHLCNKATYALNLNISSGGLDATRSFVLNYIRDPLTDVEGQFEGANGLVQELASPLEWAICDINELDDVDYAACFGRVAVNAIPRVLDLSTTTENNQFATAFSLQGFADRSMVTNAEPLDINIAGSTVRLYHAGYLGIYDVCDPASCTDSTNDISSSLVVRQYGDPDVLENFHVALEGDMPVFDEASTQDCDEGFCTMVLILNFEANAYGARLRRLAIPFEYKRNLQDEDELAPGAKQSNVLRVAVAQLEEEATSPPAIEAPIAPPNDDDEETPGIDGILVGIAAVGLVAIVVVGVVLGKFRRREEEEEEEETKCMPHNEEV